jgi:hypothetical protein
MRRSEVALVIRGTIIGAALAAAAVAPARAADGAALARAAEDAAGPRTPHRAATQLENGAGDLLTRYAPAIVRVEAVLETRLNLGGQGEAEDSRLDVLGAVVDPGGLVMIWNSHISSARMVEMMQNAGRGEGMGIQVVPRSFTVNTPDGEVSALLAATDSALDLAFLQLERPPSKPLPFVDFAHASRPDSGDLLVAVSRLGRGFDHAPYLQTALMGGTLKKPREAFIIDGRLSAFGLPVFDRRGNPVGALTTVVTRGGESDSAAGGPTVGQMIGGAFGAPGEGPLGVFVLPGERVASLIRLAGERAKELLRQRESAPSP